MPVVWWILGFEVLGLLLYWIDYKSLSLKPLRKEMAERMFGHD